MVKKLLFILFLAYLPNVLAQMVLIGGTVTYEGNSVPFASVYLKNKTNATTTDNQGNFKLKVPVGNHVLVAQSQGFRTQEISFLAEDGINQSIQFKLLKDILGLEEVVVSATRNRIERRSAPTVISALKPQLLNATQSITVSEGLNFTSGVRVENNCQNCGFTQVRLNGLDGGYTQILLNSRPVFTSLLGVYSLEQIPTTIIERIEVVRSGGSALYGSNAIAGTVNIITKDPILNSWEVGSTLSLIGNNAWDRILNFNSSLVVDDLTSGVTFFGNYRNREAYDANGDGFTELVELQNTTVGAKAFLLPTDNSRLSLNLNTIREYRRGGDRLDLAPQFTDITEELDHDTFIGGLDYELNSKNRSKKTQIYTSLSHTNRNSYYGGLGGARTQQDSITANNAFGDTKDFAWVNGLQFTQTFDNKNVLTAGAEYNKNATEDQIVGYNRFIDQSVQNLGAYGQCEWKPSKTFTALVGGRLDHVIVNGNYTVETISRTALLSQTAFSPRLTLSYLLTDALRLRGGYARGFRAPQAFNEDLHISSVGGEPQFVILSNNLNTEYSDAFTSSLNYSKNKNLLQIDFLLEGFYTTLQNPFTLVSTGAILDNGSILEEVRNGSGARVYGVNFELGISPNPKWQIQTGGTLQQTRYQDPQVLFESDGTMGESDIIVDSFVRVPNLYGYFNIAWLPKEIFNLDITGTYTGNMTVPRVISETGFLQLNEVGSFLDLNIKLESHIDYNPSFKIVLSAGVTNVFNSFQNDFDTGAMRDSDYVYGPDAPRAFFFGLKFGNLLD